MSADTSNYSQIQDEDVLRKMWQDTDDFGKKKEIRSHMYKLREQRLREFYNGSEISESKTTTTSGKITQSSTHTDSLVDQSFQSFKSKEVRDSESPTREIQYKVPDKMASKEWQVESSKGTSLDGKTKMRSSVATVEGTQKIEGGQIDFRAKSEKMSNEFRDANEYSSTNRSQTSASSRMVTSSSMQPEHSELPSNLHGVTKVIRETKTLPDGSTVTTTRYDTSGGSSQFTSQSSTSSRHTSENIISSGSQIVELPEEVQELTKINTETKTLPYVSTITSKTCDNVSDVAKNNLKTAHTTSSKRVINEKESLTTIAKETKTLPDNQKYTTTNYDAVNDSKNTIIDDTKTIPTSSSILTTKSSNVTNPELPNNIQGVTKVTKETKTLPDGSIMTITKYDTPSGTTTHSEIIGNVKISKDHSSVLSKSYTDEAITTNNRQSYKKQEHDRQVVNENRHTDMTENNQYNNTDNKITVVSTTEKTNKDQLKETVNVTKQRIGETDGNKMSPTKVASKKQPTNLDNDVENVTITKQYKSDNVSTNSFINKERQQEEVTRDKNICEVVSSKVDDSPHQEPRVKETSKPDYHPSKPTTGQYDTTYKTDYTSRKISVDVSPTHDAFARSLRAVSPDRVPSRGSHRTSNSSIAEKMRHPSRISPERQPKDRSISPTKSISTDTYIYNKKGDDNQSHRKISSTTDNFKKTVSQETITITKSKQNTTNKSTNKNIITTSNEIVTDLDEDLIKTTEKSPVAPGSRPTSLELTRKPKKITDRSPSSPLTDTKKSPTKEIRRSSSFRSPTKEPSSPTKASYPRSPTKDTPSTKNLPEDRHLKRTDTYEERCRQILGITEVTEKRKSSLERSGSKRNSLRRNISSQLVDTIETITSPSKSPTKERPVSPTKSKSPTKERPVSPTKSISPTKERLLSPTKERPLSPTKSNSPTKERPLSPTKERPLSPTKERPLSPTKSNSPIKDRSVSPTKSQSPVKERPISPTKEGTLSPTKGKIPLKERTMSPTKSLTKEKLESSTKESPEKIKSPVKDRPESPTKSRDDIDYAEITTTFTRETAYNREDQDISPIKNRPLSPTKGNQISSNEDRLSSIVTSIKTDTLISTTNRDETVITNENKESIKQIDEFTPKRKNISSNKNTNENVIESTVITSEYDTELIDSTTTSRSKSTKKPGNKKVSNQTSDSPIKSKQALVEEKNTDKVVLEDIINIEETITTDGSNYISKYKTSKKTSTDEKPQRKDSHPKEEFPTQSKMPSKHPSNNINTTSKFISQEKISTDIHSSMEVIVDEDDVKNISETEYDKIPISKKAPKTAPTSDLPKTKKVTKNISEEIKSTVGMDNNRNNTTDKSPRGSEKENIKPKGKLPSDKEKSVTEVEAREIMIIVDTDNKIQSTGEVLNQQKEESNDFIRTEQVQREVEDKNICYKKSTTDTKINESEVVTPKTSPQSKQVINKSGENIKKSIISKDDEETIIDEFVVTDESDNPKIIMGKPVPKDTKPIKKGKETLTESVKINAITKQDDTVIVTDEFEIVNKPNQQPLKNELGITEYPPQSKKTISKKISQEKITPKSKPVTQKPKPSEFPSQIKKDKRPVNKEPIVTEKFFEPISYENKVPVEEPLMIKKHINPHCREDEVEKTEITKTTTSKKVEKSTQKELPLNKQKEVKKIGKHTDKNTENSIQRKPINGISEYKDQYSKPKPTPKGPSNKIKNTIQETTKIIHKNYDEISPARNKPITKPLVNGIQKPKETPRPSKPSAVTVNSAKVTKLDTTETVTRRTNKIIVSKENMSPLQKSKKEIGMKNPVKLSTVTKNKSSQPDELITKKHVVTTTITLKDNRQPITTKPKLTTKITKSERNRVTDLKQKHINEYVSTDTDDEKIEENVEITRRTINKKPEKKCITTKTVIINNNGEQRQVIVDLQRSKSSREPTPDRICPVPTSNGEYQFPRYPDEILEPDDDEIRKKPKRLSDIPLMESEDVNDFSRITEITDTKVVTDIDKVEETDESLLSVNKKINLFLDNVDRVKQVKNKPLGPAPKVERPKLDVSEGLESDECLLSVSEKVTKFVNAADQFMNVRDIPERPKSPRCKNYDEKNTTETFIKTEQKNLENQSTNLDTGKISLNSLEKINNKISKDSKPNSENRVPSPTKFKPTLDTIDKSEQKHPKYNTITKKISLENLEIKSSVKTSENVVKPSPEKSQSRDTITTTETRETRTGSRDFSPEDKGYKNRLTPERRSPDRKSPATNNKPETPVKRPSNEYGSIKHIKTQDKISTNRDHSLVDDTTPKTSKANIVEDKKTFLSSTGRLRSTESIKKARAIFENISKEQEPTKSPLKNKSVSKKLNYTEDIRKKETTSEIDRAPLDRNTTVYSPDSKSTDRNVTSSFDVYKTNGDLPHYMLPLHRNEETHDKITHESRTVKTKSDIISTTRNISRSNSPDSLSESSDVPHYMLPLDRSVHTHSTPRASQHRSKSPEEDRPKNRTPEVHSKTGDVPHYMLPLKHDIHTHSHETNSVTRESRTKFQATGRDNSPDVRSETDDIPHYRLPLERSVHTTTSEMKDTRFRSKSPERTKTDKPHYMLPLDHHVTITTTRVSRPTTRSPERDSPRNRSPENQYENIPHYRLPIDRSVHTHTSTNIIKESKSGRYSSRSKSPEDRSESGDVPHYMLPLDRSINPDKIITSSTRDENKSPVRDGSRNRSPDSKLETDDIPHYRLPLDRDVHVHTTTSTVRESRSKTKYPERPSTRSRSPDNRSETGDVPHYMLPLDRNVHPDKLVDTSITRDSRHRSKSPQTDSSRNRTPDNRSETGDVPHYMLPLDRSVHPDRIVTNSTRDETNSPVRDSSRNRLPDSKIEADDIPHYRLPLDRDVHFHTITSKIRESKTRSPERHSTRSRSPEDRSETGDVPHYMLPLDRNVHPDRIVATNLTRESRHRTKSPQTDSSRNISPEDRSETGDIPHYMLPLDRNVHPDSPTRDGTKSPERCSQRNRSPDGRSETSDVPHYMLPLDKNSRPHSAPTSNIDTRATKFGITLRKVNIGSPVSKPSKPSLHKLPSETKFVNIESITEEDIEDIFDLEILEELLQKIEIYELRKMIRTQIRLIKSLISENTLTTYIKERRQLKSKQETITKKSSYTRKYSDQNIETRKTTSRNTSPEAVKNISPTREITRKPDNERSSPERTGARETIKTTTTTTTRYSPTRQQSPSRYSSPNHPISGKTEVTTEEIIRKSSPERITKTKVTKTSTKTEQTRKLSTERSSTTTVSSTERRNISHAPDKSSPKLDTKTGYSILKKTEIHQKKIEDDKPEWVKQRNLKKVSSPNTNEKISTNVRRTVKEENRIITVGCEPTDSITSSYGVGPTDENGTPLFGLKALRTQHNGTTKVQGTFVKSEYYSENGNAPVGQISVTKYSTDPRDLSTEEQIQNNDLITSVTTTQQFGYENTPSLETLTNKKGKQIEDTVIGVNKTSNFKRQNSVKALSQKFIDTAVDSLKNERQTSYPKAGLILRTSSFKESKSAPSEEDIPTDVLTATKTSKKTTTTTTTSGGTFLSNKSTISGVQDVITRMKTEEYQEGDTSEDIEAKSLLNKFIGSQVILSGMENRSTSIKTSKTSTSDIVPTTSSARKTIKITTTATEGGKTKTKTLVFQSPITEEELENIWDDQTLRLLLEQSTQYEERRVIRNRLRTVMAEQEACAELVEKASQDPSEGKIEENVSVEKTTTKNPTATTTTVTKVTTQQQITKKPLSPFAKFQQLDKQNSLNTPPGTPGTPKSPGNGPLFKFTDPAVSLSAATIKDRLLFWCRMKTKEYENVQLDNFSTSWADGLAFCALIHHFLPDAFDYHALTPKDRRHNFELAFRVASEKADIFPLLDVDDMMATRRPDWKCVFTYVQSVYRRFKDEEI
ncbi:mucin-2 isoform X1 [Diorhabda carinulata]|uniref:mucin-2 isoform X1 n=1 Tax=Diorhabda carinulata TaxID=1163345 RepID=UPI0025A2B14A|nr:mucin-2 isoform X1 [Diorhabda carinulata]